MRVKKLNVNRPKAKAGEDDGDADAQNTASADSTSTEWAPPGGKTYARSAAPEIIDVGGDSPTDSSATLALQASSSAGESESEYHRQAAMVSGDTGNAPSSSPSWRDRVERRTREAMHRLIVDYLKNLKPNAPAKVLEKLPGLAYRMEDTLLRVANSEAEYCDQTTLPQRLTLIQQTNAKRLLQQQSPAVSPKDKDGTQRLHGTRQPLSEEQARVVFSCLQSWRQKLVNMYGATPWEILPNQILAKVAVYIPSTLQELVICGVTNEQLERFGNSLLQEIQKVMNALNTNATATAHLQVVTSNLSRSASPSGGLKRTSPGSGGRASKNAAASTAKRGHATAAGAGNKKRKTTSTAAASASAPTDTSNGSMNSVEQSMGMPSQGGLLPSNSFLTPSPLFMRSLNTPVTTSGIPTSNAVPTSSGLPALLPSGPLPAALASAAAAAAAAAAVASVPSAFNPQQPQQQQQQPPFFPRLQAQGQASHDQDSRMHLLAQGAGQLSKQQDSRSVEVYEKEIQTLRWLLQESQREKSQLEAEVVRLREQLQASSSG
ncbi:hypothetical protein ATCC90586_000093 [Pythium insidiosum]|nr:hypothetical protein ATCC90586_000093 [Pythium insidiosum]